MGIDLALRDAGLEHKDIDAVVIGKAPDQLEGVMQPEQYLAGALGFGLLYGLTGRRLPQLHWTLWILLAIGPIGLDGFSQLFAQFEWPFLVSILPYRESTPFLRVLTGGMFGFFTAWFAYPNIEETMQETRQFFIKKFAQVKAAAD